MTLTARKFALAVVSALIVGSPTVSNAQPINPGDGEPNCLLVPNLFTNIAPTKCVGFFTGNSNSGGTGSLIVNGSDHHTALTLLGLNMAVNYNIVQANASWGGGAMGTTMTGWTVVGFHWGNYPNDYDDGIDVGNVSAFYMFDAGAGISSINLADTQGISNSVVLATGLTTTTTSVVPEPSTYALMAAGLAGLGFAARRRRNA